jgi:hypothetical protein
MAQKTNPISFRSLNNFENFYCHQQIYNKNFHPYVLKEHKKAKSFIERFFKNTNLVLHSFQFTKTYKGIVFLSLKFVFVSFQNDRESTKLIHYSTLEKAFVHGFSRLFFDTPVSISFFNLEKDKKVQMVPMSIKGPFFNSSEIVSYLYVLTSMKGSAFFFANILSLKLHQMRSRVDRKSQTRFLSFVTSLLSYVFEHNHVDIEGIKVGIKGRINGVPRSKMWTTHRGKISLQKINSEIDYYYLPSETVYGTFGIKVWINYG